MTYVRIAMNFARMDLPGPDLGISNSKPSKDLVTAAREDFHRLTMDFNLSGYQRAAVNNGLEAVIRIHTGGDRGKGE